MLTLFNWQFIYADDIKFPNDAKKTVVLIEAKDNNNIYNPIGTGFIFTSNWIYIVTAKHVLFNTSGTLNYTAIRVLFYGKTKGKEDLPAIYEIDLEKVLEYGHLRKSDRDIASLKFGQLIGDGRATMVTGIKDVSEISTDTEKGALVQIENKNCFLYDELEETDDVIFFGFPSSLKNHSGLYGSNVQFNVKKPLFRKGIIAGKNPDRKTLIVDGESHPGNSGGPVYSWHNERLGFIGLITEYIPYISISKDERDRITNVNIQNSGYSVLEPADEVIKFIQADQ